ncbi:MAG: HPr family phosphocarrier protein [bacterium]|nr:HPr family phosphocarrier protein [bacterium]
MIRKEITIINTLGLHARPAARLVKIAAGSKANFWISKNGQRINGKSIMGVMMLAAEKGSTILIEADGEGEQALIDDITTLVENKFYEE